MDAEFLRILELTYQQRERLFFFHPESKHGFVIMPLPMYEALLSQTSTPSTTPSIVTPRRAYTEADFDFQDEQETPPSKPAARPLSAQKIVQNPENNPHKHVSVDTGEDRFYFQPL